MMQDNRQNNNTSSRHVLVVHNGSMIDEGVMELVKAKTGFVVSQTRARDDDDILRTVYDIQPDVVVLDASSPLKHEIIIKYLDLAPFTQVIRFIAYNLDNNQLMVYSKSSCSISNCDEFIDLVGR